ncbi:MAG TPA: sulfur carrier protein ThiS [Candidatus Competibacteraceae bacterium]|nr:MAG: sulfur carrier protein ThiS [Candidatus Competibacteraceae bacterium]HOB63167.1 sulfur carrier protein ThiS [Candidatus Competibacteraceae bacterium]HQA24611.1 sulfur carrier protein ThiS [Candidatus Competibacteraceae bacterium]HQD55619.1 sulfur carrier protein ThiS [Candidatus Competibacteraceae bacterium]
MSIHIEVNGDPKTLDQPPYSLAEALAHWGYAGAPIAVAHNEEFVPRSRYASLQLQEGDRLEIVAPMQGG